MGGSFTLFARRTNMSLIAFILVLPAFVIVAQHFWMEAAAEDEFAEQRETFLIWACKGIGPPIFLWIIINLGILPGLPALMPSVAIAKSAGIGKFFIALDRVAAAGAFLIGSYWTAITLAWLVGLSFHATEKRGTFVSVCVGWSLLLLPVAGLIVYFGGWAGAGLAATLWLLPIAHSTVDLRPKRVKPTYSRAEAKINFGKYNEAEWEVITELEKYEDDFNGWMMLAELYANHFNDLAGAARTVRDICHHPNATPSQISVAWHRLADWYLKLTDNPAAARQALEEICERLPGTHLERMARQRIEQLPATREELLKQRQGVAVHLPASKDSFADRGEFSARNMSRDQAAVAANECVEQLKKNPNDIAARQKFAMLLAERLDRAHVGIEQLELLLRMPDQPDHKRAEWLTLIGEWELRFRRDQEAARKLFERVVHEYPQTTHAFEAQRHIGMMAFLGARTSCPRVD
jgi:uncharacterized protein (DUF1499 family)